MVTRRLCLRSGRALLPGSRLAKLVLTLALLALGSVPAFAQGSISGRVTSSTTGLGLAGTLIFTSNVSTGATASTTTNGTGNYTLPLPAGSYTIFTRNSLGYINEIYDNVKCSATCNTSGVTPISVATSAVTGIDFVLDPGSRIEGTITNTANGQPIANVAVLFFDSTGHTHFASAFTDNAGHYISDGGSGTGSVYVMTQNTVGFQNEVYNNVKCIACDPTTGSQVPVTLGVNTTSIDFALDPGGQITGTVTNGTSTPLPNVYVVVTNASGAIVNTYATNASGVYASEGLPAGTYYAYTRNSAGLVDQLYNNMICAGARCTPTTGTPITVTLGLTTANINFVLPAGGTITGIVTGSTGSPLANVLVAVGTSSSAFLGGELTDSAGHYSILVPTGSYYVRTMNAPGAVDEVYNNVPCSVNCVVTSGTPVAVSAGTSTNGINFALAANLVQNGTFANGTTNWTVFGQPDNSVVVSNVTNGVLQFYRTGGTEGEFLQSTGLTVANGTSLQAVFELGNTDSIRKRVKVLVHDLDFTDSASCTFFLDPGAPLRMYRMQLHTTKAWTNATITIYAATAGSGGFYQVDNVSVSVVPGGPVANTFCFDPTVPAAPGGAAGPNLLTNGDFATGTLSPWQTIGPVVTQITGGVLQMYRSGTSPAPVVFQSTNQTMVNDQILTATLELGNSSPNRHRMKVLIHDLDFSDSISCVFWLAPNQVRQTYTMRVFTTKAWANATISIYPSTGSTDPWTEVDNVTLQRTPATATPGTTCVEPGGTGRPAQFVGVDSPVRATSVSTAVKGASNETSSGDGSSAAGTETSLDGGWTAFVDGWSASTSADGTPRILSLDAPIDLSASGSASLAFESWLIGSHSRAEVQVSLNGDDWIAIARLNPTDGWQATDVDLSAFAGDVIFVRFALTPDGPSDPALLDEWRVRNVVVSAEP